MAGGQLLPILFFAILFGLALAGLGEKGKPVVTLFQQLADVFFGIVNIVMKVSPLAAFGAMAYTIGNFGLGSLIYIRTINGCRLPYYVICSSFLFLVPLQKFTDLTFSNSLRILKKRFS